MIKFIKNIIIGFVAVIFMLLLAIAFIAKVIMPFLDWYIRLFF
jgi:hypothetical protein